MLTGRRAAAGVVVTSLLLLAGPLTGEASADGGVHCPPTKLDCDLSAEDPGTPEEEPAGREPSQRPVGGGGKPRCVIQGIGEVPCATDAGTFNPVDSCYWKPLDPQPAKDDPIWGYTASVPDDWEYGDKGALYNVVCRGPGAELAGGTRWSATPPPGAQGGVNVEELAQRAVKQLRLQGADIGIAPKPSGTGTVGVPVWMWTEKSPTTWGPAEESVTAGGVTVTATATVRKIDWSMGDGTTVTCTTAGTPFQGGQGMKDSPDCGHRYEQTSASQSEGRFPVVATTTWEVAWTGAGQSGVITTTRTSRTSLAIGEVQVLN